MRLPNLLWPTARNIDRTGSVTLGRVLHWVALVLSVVLLALAVQCFVQGAQPERGNDYWNGQLIALEMGKYLVLMALIVYGAGRAARRLLSKE